MSRRAGLVLAWICVGALLMGARGTPVILGAGPDTLHIRDLSAEARAFLLEETGLEDARFGYFCEAIQVFWMNVHTANGVHCLYDDDEYVPLHEGWNEGLGQLGIAPDDFTVPWRYRVPPFGAFLLLCLLTSLGATARNAWRRARGSG